MILPVTVEFTSVYLIIERQQRQHTFGTSLFAFIFSGVSSTEPTFTCLKLTIKILEQGLNYVQS